MMLYYIKSGLLQANSHKTHVISKEVAEMEQKQSCLVLEGGALRGVYTAGVQGVLHAAALHFDCLIGTSAGAMNGINYITNQPERSFLIDYHFARDKNFMGLRPLRKEKQIFSFSYMFGPVNQRFPLDLAAFDASPVRFIAVASDLDSGLPAYLERGRCSDMMLALQASSSMPLLSTPVLLDGKSYLDGGPSMPIAFQKAQREGYARIVLILTRPKGYRKKPISHLTRLAARSSLRRHPHFLRTFETAPARYNAMMDEIDRQELAGSLFVIRPSEPVLVSRTEKNVDKLEALFRLGRSDAQARLPALINYIKGEASAT